MVLLATPIYCLRLASVSYTSPVIGMDEALLEVAAALVTAHMWSCVLLQVLLQQ